MAFEPAEVTGDHKEGVAFGVSSLSVKSHPETKVGDLIVLSVMLELEVSTITAAGWTPLGAVTKQGGSTWGYYYRVATEAGEKSFTVSWTGSAGAAAWATGRVTKVNAATPVLTSALKAGAASTTIKYASATPTKAPTTDLLLYMPDGEISTSPPAGFTNPGSGNMAVFYRELGSEAATGESSTTQGASEKYVTCRLIVLGEGEAAPEPSASSHRLTLLGVGS